MKKTGVEHRPPSASAHVALTKPDRCACERPIVYDDPPVIGLSADKPKRASSGQKRPGGSAA